MKTIPFLAGALFAAVRLFAEPATVEAGDARFESGDARVSLIELFTSEGCSSCPPADAWVSRLKASPELWKSVVPVVFHVDYWDHLGWPDRFASRANSDRQRRYAATWRSNSIYTPGFVLNGREWRDWSARAPAPTPGGGGKLTLTVHGASAKVSYVPVAGSTAPFRAEIALQGGALESDVRRGENSGRRLRHEFVVLQLAGAALKADGHTFTATLALPEKGTDKPAAIAAWITTGEAQPPIQATGGWLRNP